MEVSDNHLHIIFRNDGNYSKDAINAPIMIEGVAVGAITDVNDEFVFGTIWSKYVSRRIFADSGKICDIVIGR